MTAALPAALPTSARCIAPAPWTLNGSGYIFVLKLPEQQLADCPFTPASLRKRRSSPLSLAMLVDYTSSPAGPYQELLFIPGLFDFGDGQRPSISRIFVSSQASVDNGRRNWGIPKDLCDFDMDLSGHGPDHGVLQMPSGERIADFLLQPRGPELPMPAHWLPAGMRTLSQLWEGREYTLAPTARGWCRPARVLDWHFNAAHFPDLARGRCLAAFKITRFEMVFPTPRVRSWAG